VYTSFVSDDTWTELGINGTNAPTADSTHLGHWWLWYDGTRSDQTGTITTDALRMAVQREADGDRSISFRLNSPGYRTYYRAREWGTDAQRPRLIVRYITR
jgi:hypothetical protein